MRITLYHHTFDGTWTWHPKSFCHFERRQLTSYLSPSPELAAERAGAERWHSLSVSRHDHPSGAFVFSEFRLSRQSHSGRSVVIRSSVREEHAACPVQSVRTTRSVGTNRIRSSIRCSRVPTSTHNHRPSIALPAVLSFPWITSCLLHSSSYQVHQGKEAQLHI